MLIVTGSLKFRITQCHTNMREMVDLYASDVYWKWSNAKLRKKRNEVSKGSKWKWFATIAIVAWSIIIAIIILRTYSPSRDKEKNLDV